ncbi:hypothetical protein HHI36_005231 [Cryptolaemus montrouzieri]|uniref:Uncharacterized protein n=1 Tax=Cryptolaemus montrouzieri TaxID=559131 RepID=A0ABD2NTM2_9CUCU
MAIVRIGAPTAKTFGLRPMKRICRLPPGLALSRIIRMKYSRTFAVHDTQIPIFINNCTIQYPLTIFLNQAKIVVEPTEVNFGRIDAVSGVVAKTVVVRNEGTKNTGFCIDLGRNELELIVEPTKGVLQASESVTFKLEVMGFHEGPFEKEFWIKTSPPKRVTVVGEFITPKIIATYPKAYADFSMVIFPRLYIGQSANRTLMVKNISSSDVMFCIKGTHERKYMLYKEAEKLNEHYKNFHLTPLEGRLGSQQTTVIEIIFEPIESIENHAVCFIQVIRVNCTDVDDSVIIRVNQPPEPATLSPSDRSRSSLMTITSTIPQSGQDDDLADGLDQNIGNLVTDEKMAEAESFRVCLYGDKEQAKVRIRPESISLNQIQVNETFLRELWFENCSSYLPITIHYCKVAFIDIEPPKIYLKPKEAKEVAIKIKTKRAGFYSAKIEFELAVYENYDFSRRK